MAEDDGAEVEPITLKNASGKNASGRGRREQRSERVSARPKRAATPGSLSLSKGERRATPLRLPPVKGAEQPMGPELFG